MNNERVRMTIEIFDEDVDEKGYIRENRKHAVMCVTVMHSYAGCVALAKHLSHLVDASKESYKDLEWKPTA